MKHREVILTDDAVIDLTESRAFYDKNSIRLGDYFFESLIADLESLAFFAGIHPIFTVPD